MKESQVMTADTHLSVARHEPAFAEWLASARKGSSS